MGLLQEGNLLELGLLQEENRKEAWRGCASWPAGQLGVGNRSASCVWPPAFGLLRQGNHWKLALRRRISGSWDSCGWGIKGS